MKENELSLYQGFLATPSLWTTILHEVPQFNFPTCNLKTFTPKPIPNNLRIGHRIEYVFEQLLAHHKAFHIYASNIAIRNKERTLGELDFIVKEKGTERVLHIELTYKFYVILPGDSSIWDRMIGPNKKDSFASKLHKIKTRQFPLLAHEETKPLLEQHKLNVENITQCVCFKAQVFAPYHHQKINIEDLNPASVCGFWMNTYDFINTDFNNYLFYIPKKYEWPLIPFEEVTWQTFDFITKALNLYLKDQMSPMLWMREPNGNIIKIFVVWW